MQIDDFREGYEGKADDRDTNKAECQGCVELLNQEMAEIKLEELKKVEKFKMWKI